MFAVNYELMFLAFFTFLAHLGLLLIALVCGTWSLVLLRGLNRVDGLRLALVSLGICLAVEVWSILFFAPWRFPGSTPYLWLPFFALPVSVSAMLLWAMHGRRLSGIFRSTAALAAIAVTLTGGVVLQHWDHRRESLHWAVSEERLQAEFIASAQIAERCEDHVRRKAFCDRCKGASPGAYEYYAREGRKAAVEASKRAKGWRQRAYAW